MKTAEAIKDIECIVVGQKSLSQEQRNQIKTVLESYRKQHAIEFGLWVNHHRLNETENFDFAPGDTDGWYNEWITPK